MFNRTERGVEVLGVPQRFMINANWKIASEQFAGDAYHAGQLHRSLGELRGWDLNDPKLWAMYDTKVATIAGHSAICFHQDNRFASRVDGFDRLSSIDKLKALPPPGMPPEMVPEMADRFDETELATLANTPPSNGILFPHAGLWSTSALLPNGEMTSFFSLRTYVPCGIDKFEFTMWVFAERGTTQEFRDNISRTTSLAQGAAGFVEQDDAEVWPGIAANSKGYIARQNTLKYWAQAPNQPRDDWGGGGHVMTEFSRDDTQWAWWNRYYEFMTEQA